MHRHRSIPFGFLRAKFTLADVVLLIAAVIMGTIVGVMLTALQ